MPLQWFKTLSDS